METEVEIWQEFKRHDFVNGAKYQIVVPIDFNGEIRYRIVSENNKNVIVFEYLL